ncbi:hypothetical protein NLI96_g457 [Meripilus lineatus]|uniref:Uncharacterized protein n=1 Tax=Meripilus lineatus TaxID=2056292 RepID=A0AAD5VC88_9APHY|nr:hypothetical protein NLI96_g457 [Physisporinus lineatus]
MFASRSLEKGVFENDVWVGIFGLVAALASWRSGWRATALPQSSPTPPSEETKDTEKAVVDEVTPSETESAYDMGSLTISDSTLTDATDS